jgi:VIT1/CCC1 family predicted Fe2+/Mn2+ transporter
VARLKASSRHVPIYLRDWVYGGIDGSVTTFAVVAGVAGASLSTSVILILGFTNLVADGFSMAAGSYSSTHTESEQYDRLLKEAELRIRDNPEAEKAALTRIYADKGFSGEKLDNVVETVSSNSSDWARTIVAESYGFAPIRRKPLRAAANTYGAFAVFGLVPLLPYVFGLGFWYSTVMTGVAFFAIGSLRSIWTDTGWWRSGLTTFAVGGFAAAIAYLAGYLLEAIVGA